MQIKKVKIDELKPHPANPRVHPEAAINKLKRSIEEYGWTNPILVSSDGYILAGHARLKAAKKLGLEEVPVIRLPFGGLKAKAYMIADNRMQEETDWDEGILKSLMTELKQSGDNILFSTGFDVDEIEGFIADVTDPYELEDLLAEYKIVNAVEKPIWIIIRASKEDQEVLEEMLASIENSKIRIEKSYG